MSHRWSAMLSFSKTGAPRRTTRSSAPASARTHSCLTAGPDQHRVRRADQLHRLVAQVERHLDGPWDLKISPMLRFQAGQNWGRTFQATMNYGTVRIAAEPLDTNRQRDIAVTDIRVETVRPGRRHQGRSVPRRLQHLQHQPRAEHHLGVRASFLRRPPSSRRASAVSARRSRGNTECRASPRSARPDATSQAGDEQRACAPPSLYSTRRVRDAVSRAGRLSTSTGYQGRRSGRHCFLDSS